MVASLSQGLENLSTHAKKVEDDFRTAKSEAKDKVIARRDKIKADATASLEKIDAKVTSGKEAVTGGISSIKTKIKTDIEHLKNKVSDKKHDFDAAKASKRAELLEEDAAYAIDYAVAMIDQAAVAALDAIAARNEADSLKK